MTTVPVHAVLKGNVTRVEAIPGEFGPHIRIHHGDSFILEGNAQTLRRWVNALRSDIPDAIERAIREASAA